MSQASKSLTSKLGRPFWIGYGATPVLFFILLSVLGVLGDRLALWLFACVALGVVGPVGGLFLQAIHDLFLAWRLRQLRIWDFFMLVAIIAAFFLTGYVALHTQGQSRAHWVAGVFVYLLIFAYAKRRCA